MKDVEVRLACVQLAMCDELVSDKLEYAQDLYDWVIEDDSEVSDDIKGWSDGFDLGYNAGYSTALETVEAEFRQPEVQNIEDEYDRGYYDGVETAIDVLKENNPEKDEV